jgi:hypothetical protein
MTSCESLLISLSVLNLRDYWLKHIMHGGFDFWDLFYCTSEVWWVTNCCGCADPQIWWCSCLHLLLCADPLWKCLHKSLNLPPCPQGEFAILTCTMSMSQTQVLMCSQCNMLKIFLSRFTLVHSSSLEEQEAFWENLFSQWFATWPECIVQFLNIPDDQELSGLQQSLLNLTIQCCQHVCYLFLLIDLYLFLWWHSTSEPLFTWMYYTERCTQKSLHWRTFLMSRSRLEGLICFPVCFSNNANQKGEHTYGYISWFSCASCPCTYCLELKVVHKCYT